MRKQSISLSIPTPCNESWDKMTANEKGRHCASCNKTVIDFSLYTDKELVQFFKKTKGEICGRINSYQATNPIVVIEQPNRTFFHKLFLGSAIASWLGFGTTAHAQQNSTKLSLKQNNSAQHTHALKQAGVEKICRVSGKVVDTDKNPIEDAAVELSQVGTDTALVTVNTDSTGSFSIDFPESYHHKKMQLAVYGNYSYRGAYEYFTAKKSEYLSVELKKEVHMFMGKMIYRPHK